jgi:hypothetical protein
VGRNGEEWERMGHRTWLEARPDKQALFNVFLIEQQEEVIGQ